MVNDEYCREHCKGYQQMKTCFFDGKCQKYQMNSEFVDASKEKCPYDDGAWQEGYGLFEDGFVVGCWFGIEYYEKNMRKLLAERLKGKLYDMGLKQQTVRDITKLIQNIGVY